MPKYESKMPAQGWTRPSNALPDKAFSETPWQTPRREGS